MDRLSRQLALKSLGGILLSFLVATPAWARLSPEEINSIARQTTVLIAPGLTPEYIEAIERNRNNPYSGDPYGEWHPGSGVIIAKKTGTKQRYAYYVLTVTHNFATDLLEENISYGIWTTSDDKLYPVKQINDRRGCPLRGTAREQALIRFGCMNAERRIDGLDLAIISFESDKNYPVASSGDASAVKPGDTVYLSGWPDPEKEQDPIDPGRCRGKEARRQRRLAWGPVQAITSPNPNGYSIFYTDVTRPGMSGGPVFDSNGRVVGVHGRGSQEKAKLVSKYCSVSIAPASEQLEAGGTNSGGNSGDFSDRYSSAQSFNFALELLKQASINLPLNQQSPTPEMIRVALSPMPDHLQGQETGVFDDPNDVIENIYEGFQFNLLQQLRVCPTGVLIDC